MSESMRPPLSSKNSGPTSTTSSFMATKHPIVQAASGVSEVRTKNECHPEQSWARLLRPTESKDLRFKRHKYVAQVTDMPLGWKERKSYVHSHLRIPLETKRHRGRQGPRRTRHCGLSRPYPRTDRRACGAQSLPAGAGIHLRRADDLHRQGGRRRLHGPSHAPCAAPLARSSHRSGRAGCRSLSTGTSYAGFLPRACCACAMTADVCRKLCGIGGEWNPVDLWGGLTVGLFAMAEDVAGHSVRDLSGAYHGYPSSLCYSYFIRFIRHKLLKYNKLGFRKRSKMPSFCDIPSFSILTSLLFIRNIASCQATTVHLPVKAASTTASPCCAWSVASAVRIWPTLSG